MEHATGGQDFIASELLKELKCENARKDAQVKRLQTAILVVVIIALLSVLATIGTFVWYLNQYDFTGESTVTTEYSTVQTAEGVYAIIDSAGNVVGQDLSGEDLNALMEELLNGESDSSTYYQTD